MNNHRNAKLRKDGKGAPKRNRVTNTSDIVVAADGVNDIWKEQQFSLITWSPEEFKKLTDGIR